MKKRYEDGVVPQLNQEIRTEFAKQMREIRLSQNLTQQVLADRVGTKKSNISRFESGKYNPSVEFLMKLADGLGKEIQIVVGDK